MKRFFTLAIISMVAMISFAQAPAQVKKAAQKKIEHVLGAQSLAKMNETKAQQAAMAEKAKAANESGVSVVRRGVRAGLPEMKPVMVANQAFNAQITRQALNPVKYTAAPKSFKAKRTAAGKELAATAKASFAAGDAMRFAPAKTAPTDGGYFYIQNVESGLYMCGANSWGTQASATVNGEEFLVAAVEGGYTITGSQLSSASKTLGYNLFVDTNASQNGNVWTIASVAGEDGVYTIWGKGKKDNVEDSFEGYIAQSATAGPVIGFPLEGVSEVTDAAKWRFVTKDEALAGIEAGDDVTFLFSNANFTRNHATSYWTVDEGCTNKNLSGGANNNFCAESWHSIFNIHQTVTGIPNGTYTVTAQGFYRQDGSDNENLPVFYANDATAGFPNVTSEGVAEEDDDHKLEKDGVWIPNSMAQASNLFTKGGYTIEAFEVEVTDGTLTIGVKNENNANLWCIWDNFQVTCKELAVEATVVEAVDAATTYYASDGDWYCVLKDADNNLFYFDIVTNNPAGLEIGHEYTLADMDASYSYMKVGSKNYAYSSATFTPKQGQYGTDYEATCVLAADGTTYHIFYTAPEPQAVDVEATSATVKFYGEPDNDWFVILSNENFEFRYDIPNQSAEGLVLDHEYTFADMDASYSWGKNRVTGESITYQSVSFKATTGANGTDYASTVVDKKGNTYNVKYTTVAPPPVTETVELEFAVAETDLVDAASTMGLIQFVGSKEDTGLEAYVGLITTQVAGEYTFEDVEALYTSIYLDYNDYEGVQCADLTGTVTDLGNGAYKAVFEYLGTNGTLYKLTYNYGEAGDPAGEVVVDKDAHGIITSVTGGEARVYTRSGNAFYAYVQSQQQKYAYQSGNVNVIVDGNDFYIKDIICEIGVGTWVKGTLNEDGTKLVIPAGQMIYWSAQGGYGMTVNYGDYTTGGWIKSDRDITYTVDGNTLTLDGAHASVSGGYINFEDAVLGAFWTDDDSFAGYGEWSTVLTYDPGYVGPSYDLVELPDGAQTADWYLNGSKLSDSSTTAVKNQAIKTAFVGDDVYVQGLFTDMPNAWVKGTISGSAVTFAKGQYLGKYATSYDIWFMGTDGEGLTDATASYDAEKKEITLATDILANAKPDAIYYLSWLQDVVLSKDAKSYEEPTITTLTATLPYANSFDTEAEQAEAAIYDANDDGKTFTFADDNKSGSKTARYSYSTANNGDDYVVFPGLTLTAGTSYKVSVDARPYGASYPERLEVVAGTEAKASKLNISVIPATDVATADYQTFTADFTPEADGVYYFAIHAISDADQFYLYTDNFAVKENNMNAPAAIDSLVVTPNANAELKAELKFTTPSKNLAGEEYEPTAVCSVVIARDGEVLETLEVSCGQEITYVDDTMEKPGTYTWSVTPTINDFTADATKATAYVGEDLPMDVEKLAAADKNTKVALTWDAVGTLGAKGGIVKPENVWYNAYPVEMVEFWGMQFPSIDFENPYATGITGTSYDVDFNTNEGEQAYSYFAVTAENAAGETNGTMAALLTGAPYELPVVEEFPEGTLTYWWGVDYDDNIYEADGGLGVTEDGQLVFQAPVAGWIELYSGKISTNGADKAQLSFSYSGAGKLNVTVYSADKQANDVVLVPGAEAQTAAIDLSEFASEPWVRFTIHADFEAAGVAYVDNFVVMNMVDDDLEIAVAAPKTVVAGGTANVVATVKNVGVKDASDYSVKFYINEVEAPAPLFEYTTLKFMETASFEFPVETSIFDEAGDITVKAEVVYAADVNPETNTDEAVITLVAAGANPIENLAAVQAGDSVNITWTVPESTVSEVTEDFESYEVGITADGETMGPWSAIDGDKGMTYGWSSESINWVYTGELYAFGIMNFPTVFGAATDIEAASGDQALMFMSVTDADGDGFAADDWFISPALPGVAQTIKFKTCPMTANYGAEKVEVWASSTTADKAAFTKLASYDCIEENTWEEHSVQLAEGTKYFALHYVSNDIFALFVDDVTYTTISGVKPESYNIYIDEVLVAGVEGTETSYTYNEELSVGEHTVAVSAIVNGKETAPVTTTVNIETAIKGLTIDLAAKFNVYSVEGVCVRKNVTNLNGLTPGVYVVNGKKVLVK